MKFTFVLILSFVLASPLLAQTDHNHDHNHEVIDFGAIEEGWAALEDVSAELRAAVETANMTALHALADKLHAIADGLSSYAGEVPEANQLRFTSSLNQIRTLSDRFYRAHESDDLLAAERLVPQLNGMVQLLMVSAEDQ